MTPRVALIGAGGYGLVHRKAMAPLHDAGALDLVALCDVNPVRDEPGAPVPATARVFSDYRELLAGTGVDVVIVATPPYTHLEIAIAAARAGADLLLEKPPVMSLADHNALAAVLAETGRVCQVGFQALGSAALAELVAAVRKGILGRVTGVAATGAWQRPDSYYRRSPWAGKRSIGGRPSLDGALANPFAHAVMQGLCVAAASGRSAAGPASGGPAWPVEVELECYRARRIEVDDTAVVRLRLDGGPPVVVAVSLCADHPEDPRVIVHAERGRAVLAYTRDRLQLPGEPAPRQVPGRTSLLANLLAHRTAGEPLLAPLAGTIGFTAVIEAITAAPPPVPIAERFQAVRGEGADAVVTVPGVTEVLRRAADQLALPSELDVLWATASRRVPAGRQSDASGVQQPGGHSHG